jgi:hypothetical protein
MRVAVPDWLEDAENGLTSRFRGLLNGLWADLKALERRIAELDGEIEEIARHDPVALRLQQLRGVGPITATAVVAAVGGGEQFASGRQMAASLGLTPRQHSSGGRERLLGISKRGDAYLRCLLIHGARAVIRTAGRKDDRFSQWVTTLAARRHTNIPTWQRRRWPTRRRASPGPCSGITQITSRIGRCDTVPRLSYPLTAVPTGALQPRLQSKPNDGEQVEPAPAEPGNVQVREARKSSGEQARE